MEYFIVAAVLGGFGYFIYTRVKKAKADKGTGGGGSGPGDQPPMDQH